MPNSLGQGHTCQSFAPLCICILLKNLLFWQSIWCSIKNILKIEAYNA